MVWFGKSKVLRVVSSAIVYLNQRKNAQVGSIETGEFTGSFIELWLVPKTNKIEVYVDASVVSGNYSFGIGWVARDNGGTVIETKSMLLPGCIQPSISETVM